MSRYLDNKMETKKKWWIILGVIFFILFICDMRLKTVIYAIESEKINNPVKIESNPRK